MSANLTPATLAEIAAFAAHPENAAWDAGKANGYLHQLLREVARLTARVKAQQDEMGSQEVQMLRLIRAAQPLPFPANAPPETDQQYFCLQHGGRVELLLWADNDDTTPMLPCWQERDGAYYYPITRRVLAFWLHPQATPALTGNAAAYEIIRQPMPAAPKTTPAAPFAGCWGNSSCPCNPADPNDCPCYLPPTAPCA